MNRKISMIVLSCLIAVFLTIAIVLIVMLPKEDKPIQPETTYPQTVPSTTVPSTMVPPTTIPTTIPTTTPPKTVESKVVKDLFAKVGKGSVTVRETKYVTAEDYHLIIKGNRTEAYQDGLCYAYEDGKFVSLTTSETRPFPVALNALLSACPDEKIKAVEAEDGYSVTLTDANLIEAIRSILGLNEGKIDELSVQIQAKNGIKSVDFTYKNASILIDFSPEIMPNLDHFSVDLYRESDTKIKEITQLKEPKPTGFASKEALILDAKQHGFDVIYDETTHGIFLLKGKILEIVFEQNMSTYYSVEFLGDVKTCQVEGTDLKIVVSIGADEKSVKEVQDYLIKASLETRAFVSATPIEK